jgi:4-hydroxy-4-methyl-2-oxoglutarate aldolase
MFKIGPVPAVQSPEVLELAKRIMPSTIGHMTDRGFAHGLSPITPTDRCVGTAFTVRIPDTDSVAVHYAVDHISPGHVVVIDMGADLERACVGAMVAFTAKARGAAGIIVDGMATDLGDLQRFDVPVFARGTSAMTTSMNGIEGDVNVPVTVGGTTVTPGQVVIADPDGVLFIDESDLLALADRAIAAQDWEEGVKKNILDGQSLSSQSRAEELMAGRMIFI